MARTIGRTKTWIWSLLGAFCALVFGRDALAAEAVALYGVRARPPVPVDREPVKPLTAEEQAELNTTIDRYLAGEITGAVEVSDEEAARIDALVKQLGVESFDAREKAQAELRTLGTKAFAELREAAKSGDAEVADRAERLLARIGDLDKKAVREAFGRFGRGAGPGVYARIARLRREAMLAAKKAAEAGGDEEKAAELRAEGGEKNAQAGKLTALARDLGLAPAVIVPSPAGKYGVRPKPQIRYGVRRLPPEGPPKAE